MQEQAGGWLPQVADLLGMPKIRALEVETFYTMFNLRPVGRYLLQACTTTPCWLRGSDAVVQACERKLGIGVGGTAMLTRRVGLNLDYVGGIPREGTYSNRFQASIGFKF